jgi:putative transposase
VNVAGSNDLPDCHSERGPDRLMPETPEAEAFIVRDRRSIRLPGYDYRREGSYFVTICTQGRVGRFGTIDAGQMRSNDAGRMIRDVWDGLPSHYPGVGIDAFVVMPDHVHGVIVLTGDSVGAGPRACPSVDARNADVQRIGQPQGVAPTEPEPARPVRAERLSLPDVVHRFKSLTTARYRDGVKRIGWPAFDNRLWQRNYHEHIIRDDAELARIRRYIDNNPTHVHLGLETTDEGYPG